MSETRFEAERKEILKRYRNLIRAIKPTTDAERKQIRKALNLAIDAHKNTRRKEAIHTFIIRLRLPEFQPKKSVWEPLR